MTDDRAVSTALSYTLTLSIAALLVSGLLFAGGNFVDDRRESVLRTEGRVIAQQIASDVQRVDRMATAGQSYGSVDGASLDQKFPDRIAGSTYLIALDPGSPTSEITVQTTDPEVTVTASVWTEQAVRSSSTDGGTHTVEYDTATNELVIVDG